MGASVFFPVIFMAMFSGNLVGLSDQKLIVDDSHMLVLGVTVSSAQISKPSVFKLEENQEPVLILKTKNEANLQGQRKLNRQDSSLTKGRPGMLILQEQPGYSNQQVRPEVLNQSGWMLQGTSEDSKKNPDASKKQEESGLYGQQGNTGSSSQLGKPASSIQQGTLDPSSQQGKPVSSSQQGKPGSPNQQGKPVSSSQQVNLGTFIQQGKPGSSSQQRNSRSSYTQGERKNIGNSLKSNIVETQTRSTSTKSPLRNTQCASVYKPVCGSDGKTYGNLCVFKEAKRLSKGRLNLRHEGKC